MARWDVQHNQENGNTYCMFHNTNHPFIMWCLFIRGWFEKLSESPLDVSARATRFPCNNHASFVSEHVARQCSCCRTVIVMTLCCCFRILISENGKTEIRRVINYFVKKCMKAKEIHADFQNTLGDSAPSYSTVAKWTSKFKFGWESLDMIHVMDNQKVLVPQNISQTCIKWSWRIVDSKYER